MDGRRTTGDLREISTDGVLLDVDGKLVTIPAAEIRELGVTSDSFKNGALIGLATGAGLGMFAAAASRRPFPLEPDVAAAGPTALIGLVAGAAAGVGIGIGADVSQVSGGPAPVHVMHPQRIAAMGRCADSGQGADGLRTRGTHRDE